MMGNATLPPPPTQRSIEHFAKGQWDYILREWRRGYAADSTLETLNDYLEHMRERIFVKRDMDEHFDWPSDWMAAMDLHKRNSDLVNNLRNFNQSLKAYWGQWTDRVWEHSSKLAIEALRSMILLNGAAIIVSLTVLSGQVEYPPAVAIQAAKFSVFFAIVSLIMIAFGNVALVARSSAVAETVRSALVGSPRHLKLYALRRYVHRYLSSVLRIVDFAVYGSIAVFCAGALVAAFILLSA